MQNNLIALQNMTLWTPLGRKLLSGVEFNIKRGHVLLLKGDNGIGKSELIQNILGLKKNYSGTIQKEILEDDFAYLPQIESSKLRIPLNLADLGAIEMNFFSKELMSRSWNKASGGERKKALLSKVLNEKKALYVLDEPLNHLDLQSQELVMEKINSLAEIGKAVVIIGHGEWKWGQQFLKQVDVNQWRS